MVGALLLQRNYNPQYNQRPPLSRPQREKIFPSRRNPFHRTNSYEFILRISIQLQIPVFPPSSNSNDSFILFLVARTKNKLRLQPFNVAHSECSDHDKLCVGLCSLITPPSSQTERDVVNLE